MVTYADELNAWIADTTRGLCEEARTRIAGEVEAHTRATMTQLQQDGAPEQEAAARSVQDLGSARKARRRFRRRYLTEWESSTLRRITDSSEGKTGDLIVFVYVYLFGLPIVLAFGIATAYYANFTGFLAVLGVAAVLVLFGCLCVLARKFHEYILRRYGTAGGVLLMASFNAALAVGILVFLAWMIWMAIRTGHDALSDDFVFYVVMLPCNLFACLFGTVFQTRVWRKLTRGGEQASVFKATALSR